MCRLIRPVIPRRAARARGGLIAAALASALFGGVRGVTGEVDVRDILKKLEGCFEVSYRFMEDGAHDKEFKGDLLEEITFEEKDGIYVFQHYGISEGRRIKHWREQWRRNADGSFTQTVIGPFEDFRYECTAPFRFNQWRCLAPSAPKPQRDRNRTDYQILDRENILQITPNGWVQSENNLKRTAAGMAVANELGWNEYRRVGDAKCRVSTGTGPWLRRELGLKKPPTRVKADPPRTVVWGGQEVHQPRRWEVNFAVPQRMVLAEYWPGNSFATVKRIDGNLWAFLTRLHMASGVSAAWILLADSIAGSLIALALTGVLLWTRLHGPRLLAAGLGLGSLLLGLGFAWQSM